MGMRRFLRFRTPAEEFFFNHPKPLLSSHSLVKAGQIGRPIPKGDQEMERAQMQQDGTGKPPHEDSKHLVIVSVDGTSHRVPKGKYDVAEFKAMVGVPAEYELDQVEGGRFDPLPDDGTVHIKGDEVFVSHVRRGGSS
jgi:hypothetical protein